MIYHLAWHLADELCQPLGVELMAVTKNSNAAHYLTIRPQDYNQSLVRQVYDYMLDL